MPPSLLFGESNDLDQCQVVIGSSHVAPHIIAKNDVGMSLRNLLLALSALALMCIGSGACNAQGKPAAKLDPAQIEEIVRRSYQYVAMYNVNNKFAMDPANPMSTGGWNKVRANTALADHTLKAIARPNNDTLYAAAMLDLRDEPVILEAPAFDSVYVSLMATGYDHYVNIPMSTGQGDFSKPSRILFYSKRTRSYEGEKVEGIDKTVEMTGDFISAIYRVMPHIAAPDRLKRNLEAMQSIKVKTLTQYKAKTRRRLRVLPWNSPPGILRNLSRKRTSAEFPAFGKTDFDVFENNLLEVMQFVFNHTTFDPDDELDQKLLAIYAPLGVVPGRAHDPGKVAEIDGATFREVARRIARTELAKTTDPKIVKENVLGLFQPKGRMTLERLVFQSVSGPIGQPASEAVYPPIATTDGSPMNAKHDYVLRMKKKDLPPAKAFWSATLYNTENGFFIPNDRKKYSVGENGGYKLNAEGGIEIHIAAEKPAGVPEENWLPINRGDDGIDIVMRIYAPDLERYKNWPPPKVERVK